MENDEIDISSLNKCRQIKEEILNFGISQDEIVLIIKNLCLESENLNFSREVNDSCNKYFLKETKNKLIK